MIVSFLVRPSGSGDFTANYINFLRCVTAIATAPAGTTSLTVNPYTSTGVINTSFNCIQSIIANTEGGGWTTSSAHSVPSSGNNTATSYTALNSAADFAYVADFYNTSTKSATPFKKLSFHSYNNNQSSYGNNYLGGQATGLAFYKGNMSDGMGTNILVTFGASSTSNWSDSYGRPEANVFNSDCRLNKVYTLGANTFNATSCNGGHPLEFGTINNTTAAGSGILFTMAVTADYCVIWEEFYQNGTSPYNLSEWGYGRQSSGSSPFNNSRYTGFVYCGLRTTQAWEDTLTNNVPWVAMSYNPCYNSATPGSGATTSTGQQFPHSTVAALMHTLTNSGTLNSTRGTVGAVVNPCVIATTNSYNQNYFDGFVSTGDGGASGHSDTQGGSYPTTSVNYSTSYPGNRLDGPLWNSRNKGQGVYSGHIGSTANILYKPVVDPTTGVLVPPAVPITISRSYTDDWNPGGTVRGLYKSLSGTATFIKKYWLSPTQTFTINGEPYLPFVMYQDMFLVRFA